MTQLQTVLLLFRHFLLLEYFILVVTPHKGVAVVVAGVWHGFSKNCTFGVAFLALLAPPSCFS